jgi:hypothetical protein
MTSVYDTLYNWARKTSTSFGELRYVISQRDEHSGLDGDGLIYRLKHWPDLPRAHRTAGVFRALSVMSNRPVNRPWILRHAKLRPADVDRLLARLIEDGAVEVIDSSRWGPDSR